jgi:hypothetical protein
MTMPAGASGTANPVASARSCPVSPSGEGVGDGVPLIVGNRPDALPAETTELPGPASEGSGIGGSVGSKPAAGAAPTAVVAALLRPPACPVEDAAGDVFVVAGAAADRVAAGLGVGADFDGDGDGVGVGATTETVASADGGVHGSSVGTLAVAVSDTEAAPAAAGSSACNW